MMPFSLMIQEAIDGPGLGGGGGRGGGGGGGVEGATSVRVTCETDGLQHEIRASDSL